MSSHTLKLRSLAAPEAARVVEHALRAIHSAREVAAPFRHLQMARIFPADVYAAMLAALPEPRDYRAMSGRAKDCHGTRTKMDLFPESLGHLGSAQQAVWRVVGRALCSPEVRAAFAQQLAPGLEKHLYPVPVLTRDVPGYRIGIHPDTRWKGITIQLYLPRDRSIEHVGTVFHRRTGHRAYERVLQMPFAPNTGYAFAVGADTYHSVDLVGPEVRARDSILLTYYLDDTPVQVLSNRLKRIGNLVGNELRRLRR